MQLLKVVVIGMGVLIVAGLGILGYGIMNDWHKKGDMSVVESPEVEVENGQSVLKTGAVMMPAHIPVFGNVDIILPDGAIILSTQLSDVHILVRYRVGQENYLKVVRLSQSQESTKDLGTIRFVNQP